VDPSGTGLLPRHGDTRPVPGCCLGTAMDTDTITIVGQDGALRRFDRDDGTSLATLPGFDGPERVLGLFGGYVISEETTDQDVGNELMRLIHALLTGQTVAQSAEGSRT